MHLGAGFPPKNRSFAATTSDAVFHRNHEKYASQNTYRVAKETLNMSTKKVKLESGKLTWNPKLGIYQTFSEIYGCAGPGYDDIESLSNRVAQTQQRLAQSVYSIKFLEAEAPYFLMTAKYPEDVAQSISPTEIRKDNNQFNRKFKRHCPIGWFLSIIEYNPSLGYYVHRLGNAPTDVIKGEAFGWRRWTDPEWTNVELLQYKQDFYDYRAELFTDKAYIGRAKVVELFRKKHIFSFVQQRNCPMIRPGEYTLTRDDFTLQQGLLVTDLLPKETTLAEALAWRNGLVADQARPNPRNRNHLEAAHFKKICAHKRFARH